MSNVGFRKRFGMAPSGNSSGVASNQINTRGLIDQYTTCNDDEEEDVSFYLYEIVRCRAFASEVITQPLSGNVTYNSEGSALAHKTPDMLSEVYVVIRRPPIVGLRPGQTLEGFGSSGSSKSSGGGKNSTRFSKKSQRFSGLHGHFPAKQKCQSKPSRRSASRRTTRYVDDGDEDWSQMSEEDVGEWESRDDNADYYEDLQQYYDEEEDESEEEEEVYARYVDSFGHVLIARAVCSLAGMAAQSLSGLWMYAWHELTAQPCRRHDDVIGKYDTDEERLLMSQREMMYYVECPFSFTRYTSRALSIIGMRFHPISFSIATASLESVLQVSHSDVTVYNTETGHPISNNDIDISLDLTYVFLSTPDRIRQASVKMQVLWEQVQYVDHVSTGPQIRLPLTLSNPIRALVFMVQREEAVQSNNTFDFGTGNDLDEPIEYVQLLLNTAPRISRKGGWLRRLVPLKHWRRRLDKGVFIYSIVFGADGFSEIINGTQNFSRLETAEIICDLHPSLHKKNMNFHMMAFGLNVGEFHEGLFQMLFL